MTWSFRRQPPAPAALLPDPLPPTPPLPPVEVAPAEAGPAIVVVPVAVADAAPPVPPAPPLPAEPLPPVPPTPPVAVAVFEASELVALAVALPPVPPVPPLVPEVPAVPLEPFSVSVAASRRGAKGINQTERDDQSPSPVSRDATQNQISSSKSIWRMVGSCRKARVEFRRQSKRGSGEIERWRKPLAFDAV